MTQKGQDILRWVLVLPALVVVWFVANILLMLMLLFLYGYSAGGASDLLDVLFIVFLFLLYCIAPFFTAWGIAPKYKKIAGICATIVIVVFQFFVISNI